MEYSLTSLTTQSECDSLLNVTTKEKEDLTYRRTTRLRNKDSNQEKSIGITAETQSITAELTARRQIDGSLPEGAAKSDNLKRIKKLELREFMLAERSDDFGAVAVIENEYELALIEHALIESDKLIAALQARKRALGGV